MDQLHQLISVYFCKKLKKLGLYNNVWGLYLSPISPGTLQLGLLDSLQFCPSIHQTVQILNVGMYR